MFSIDKSDGMNDDEIKRLDDFEKRLQDIELKTPGMCTPESSHIKPVDVVAKVYQTLELTLQTQPLEPVDVFQISNYPAGTHLDRASFAIDGDIETAMHTLKHTNPWWAADMGGNYHVKIVVITNRQDVYANRALNLRVGLTNTSPVVGQNLALDAYTLCHQKPGLMGVVGIVSCPDEVSGQYLIVQFKTTEYMHIAEVKIYGFEKKS